MSQDVDPGLLRVPRIIWLGMFSSIFIYIGMTFFLVMPDGFEAQEGQLEIFTGAFAVTSLSIVGVAFFLRQTMYFKRFARGDISEASAPAAYQTTAIVSFAMAEAIALFGFVLHMTTYDPIAPFPFFGLGIVLLLVLFPKNDHLIGRGF